LNNRQSKIIHEDLLKVIKNSSWLVLDKLTRGVITLTVGVYLARYLGPKNYGQYSYVLAYLAVFQCVANLGLDAIVVRDIVRIQAKGDANTNDEKKALGSLLGTVFELRILSGFLCWIIGIAIIWAVSDKGAELQEVYIMAIAGFSLLFQSADVIDLWFQSQSKSKRTVLAKLTAYIASNGVRILMVVLSAKLVYFALAVLLESIFTATAMYISYKGYEIGGKLKFEIKKIGRGLLRESYPMWLSAIFAVTYSRVDQILVGNYLGASELGVYAVAVGLCSIPTVVASVLYVSIMPILSKNSHNTKVLNAVFCDSVSVLFFISLSITIALNIFSEKIIISLYGSNYIGVIDIIKVYSWTIIPAFIGNIQGAWIVVSNKTKYAHIQTVVPIIIAIISNIVLIPSIGVLGAAYSSLISQYICIFIMPLFLFKELFYLTAKGIFKVNINRKNYES